jgi:hypothetical protein
MSPGIAQWASRQIRRWPSKDAAAARAAFSAAAGSIRRCHGRARPGYPANTSAAVCWLDGRVKPGRDNIGFQNRSFYAIALRFEKALMPPRQGTIASGSIFPKPIEVISRSSQYEGLRPSRSAWEGLPVRRARRRRSGPESREAHPRVFRAGSRPSGRSPD